MKPLTTFITYSGDDETLITTPASEQSFITAWFTEGGRDLEEYDRTESNDACVRVRVGGMVVDG